AWWQHEPDARAGGPSFPVLHSSVDARVHQSRAARRAPRQLGSAGVRQPRDSAFDRRRIRPRVTSGIVALNGDAIAALLNATTFNYPGAAVKHLRIRIENGQLVQ